RQAGVRRQRRHVVQQVRRLGRKRDGGVRLQVAAVLLAVLATAFGIGVQEFAAEAAGAAAFDHSRLDATMPGFLAEYKVAGVGIGVIRDGVLVWEGYYGEQGPGVPVSAKTVFNTASVAKPVTAETMIALAGKGLIDLD